MPLHYNLCMITLKMNIITMYFVIVHMRLDSLSSIKGIACYLYNAILGCSPLLYQSPQFLLIYTSYVEAQHTLIQETLSLFMCRWKILADFKFGNFLQNYLPLCQIKNLAKISRYTVHMHVLQQYIILSAYPLSVQVEQTLLSYSFRSKAGDSALCWQVQDSMHRHSFSCSLYHCITVIFLVCKRPCKQIQYMTLYTKIHVFLVLQILTVGMLKIYI